MEKDLIAENKKLKKEYLESERSHQDEKECLLKVISALGPLVIQPELEQPYHKIKESIHIERSLDFGLIEKELGKIKKKLVAEKGGDRVEGTNDQVGTLQKRLLETCRSLRKVMIVLLEEFYPLTGAISKKAAGIEISCPEEVEDMDIAEPTDAFLDFLHELRIIISEDFKQVNRVLLLFVEQMKGLEDTLRKEFGQEENLKQIEYFEMKVHHEIGSIFDTFALHRTMDEIKKTIVEKVNNIKELVTKKKQEDLRKTVLIQENIKHLKQRLTQVEKEAIDMSQRAEQFETAAMKDGLTGLYNRKAFDLKVQDAIKVFNENHEPFALIFFDVDGFKKINDSFGHVAGDKVLTKVAQCLKETFRADDFIARYGGDEFVVVVNHLTKELAREKIMTFRANLKKRRFVSYEKGDIDVGVSTGISLVNQGDTAETLLHRADQAMYESKNKRGV